MIVTGEASVLRWMCEAATSKIRACAGSKKSCGPMMPEIRSNTSLFTRTAPRSCCSASMLCGSDSAPPAPSTGIPTALAVYSFMARSPALAPV